ncbi:PREDICTED: uncharacterized protein LOC104715037 [Camelina sativa]|uniref:Uncharacterized protein LOC104715037 n=1 Tax=Camelina sativa TaxID=90675 RepID=A0ABM0TSW9_CAMSA|nr:PREDICTED: uncharacterized protein LOC104715037 [Camelina sativa]
MWNELFTRFRVNNLPRKYQLEQAMITLKQGDLDLSTYFTKKKTLWEQLCNTRSRTVKKCDCDQVKELLEEAEVSRVIQFLMGLNDNFNNIRGQILNMKPLPGLSEIYNILDQDESQRVVGNRKPLVTPSAFQTQTVQSEPNQILMAQGNFQKPKCSHCSRLGHTVDKCYKVHGYPPGHPRAKKNTFMGSTNLTNADQFYGEKENCHEEKEEDMSKDQIQHMISYLSSKLQSTSVTACPDKAIASTSNSVPTISQMTGTFLSLYDLTYYDMLTSSIPHETELSFRAWVIDSGASHHVTHEREMYVEYQALERTYVRLPNGQTVKIEGTGYIQLTDALGLYNVLYIPEFKFNLLSALTQEVMIGRGSQVANLYVLSLDKKLVNLSSSTFPVQPEPNQILMAQGNFQKPKCSHCSRLGHTVDKCYKVHGYPPGHPRAKKNTFMGSTNLTNADQFYGEKENCHEEKEEDMSKDQIQHMISYLSSKLQSTSVTACPDKAIASTSNSVPTISQMTGTFLSLYDLTYYDMLTSSIPHETELSFRAWVIDSGASHHVTHEREMYVEYQALERTYVRLPNGQTVKIEGTGYIQLTDALGLYNVLYIPEFKFNLLSALTQEVMIGRGSQVANLYVLSLDKKLVNLSSSTFPGYPSGFKGYKLLDIETYSVSVSRHVIFYEDIFPFASSTISDDAKTFFPHFSLPVQINDGQSPLVQPSSDAPHNSDESSSMVSVPSELKPTRQRKLPSHLQDFHCYNNNTLTNSNHKNTFPYPLANYISYSYLSEPFYAFTNIVTKAKIPQRYSEARLDKVWVDACGKEIGAFIRTGTWSVSDLPHGYTQQEGIDFSDTFSPVAKLTTVKMIISLAPKMQWSLHQLDISNAFLNGDLDEEIYMKLPPGYEEILGETVPANAVCRLHKSIYGLKQASRQWFLKFKSTLKSFGFETCHGEHTLFVKETSDQFLVVVVYVDDILIASTNADAACALRDQLGSVFQLRDLGTPKFFLGIEIARNDEGITFSQRKYVLDLLEATGFSDCKPSPIPMKPDLQMSSTGLSERKTEAKLAKSTMQADDEILDTECIDAVKVVKKPFKKLSAAETALIPDSKQYRRLIGKLQYLTITRPDISYAVSKLAQYSTAPRKFHLTAVHKILRYLKAPRKFHLTAVHKILRYLMGTIGQGLFYGKDHDFSLRGFSDADWGGCPDNRRSHTGYAIFIGQSLVSWKSKKQQVVSMSSAESEYRAMSMITKELLWFTYILKALRVPFTLPAYLYCDNTAALYIASNSVYHERTKHIEFDCHKVREAIEDGILKTMFVRTNHQLADVLTKALHPIPFQEIMRKMGVINIYSSPS